MGVFLKNILLRKFVFEHGASSESLFALIQTGKELFRNFLISVVMLTAEEKGDAAGYKEVAILLMIRYMIRGRA